MYCFYAGKRAVCVVCAAFLALRVGAKRYRKAVRQERIKTVRNCPNNRRELWAKRS